MKTTDFFDLIYGDTEGWIAIATREESSGDAWEINSEKWFYWPEARGRVEKYVRVRDDEDVYNSVALFSEASRTKMDRNAVSHVVYVDADECDPSKFRVPPTITNVTSEGKYHCYWVLTGPVPASEASRISRRICHAHADDGCDNGFQVSKILRVPNTSNTKYGSAFKVTAESTGIVYDLSEIESAYSDIPDAGEYAVSDEVPIPVAIGTKAFVALEQRLDVLGVSSLYLEVPDEDYEDSWSERAFRLEMEMFRGGFSTLEVFSLMRNAACNKYLPDNAGRKTQTGVVIPLRSDPDRVLWEEVQKAHGTYLADAVVLREEKTQAPSQPLTRREFISLEERKWVHDNPTWVQEYVDWMAERTDSPEIYQRTLAYIILGACLSGRGKVSTPHSVFGLNLWMMGVGESTLDRKTTALNSAMAIINGFAKEMLYEIPIDVGSDFTKEGIITTLGVPERDHKSALVHIDEVNGFFSEVFQKSYRAGTLEALTALYGGEVPKSLRAGKDAGNPNAVNTHLSFMGFGIESKIASLLTTEHFESGFLARMVWAVADEPKRRKNSNAFEFLDEATTKKVFDKSRHNMVMKIVYAARNFPENPDRIISFEKSAQNRLNTWIEHMTGLLYTHPERATISASIVRMFTTAAKCCALLAMYDHRDTVEEGDVLHVLAQCELWVRDLERMSTNIANSDYEKKLHEIVDWVFSQKDHCALESSLRKKFARYRSSEFDDMLASLKKQGRLRLHPQKEQTIEAIDD